jgi:hypothetical protein
MPVTLRSFLICFVALCIAFVPVLYYAGLYASIEPASALILHTLEHRIDRASWFIGIHVSIYIYAFTAIGALAYVLVRLLPWRAVRVLLVAALLALPITSSFARVITYSCIQGSGGTYTFWTAVHRYFERQH